MAVDKLEQLLNRGGVQSSKGSKALSTGGGDFSGMMDAVSAMNNTATTAASMYGSSNSTAVLAAAFSGISAASAQGLGGGGTPSMATGTYGMGSKALSTTSTSTDSTFGSVTSSDSSVIAGTEGFSQMDMINTMNQNNLQLLELQAVMQSNMQAWNTKSNILSADHRARMAMIEKFTARG